MSNVEVKERVTAEEYRCKNKNGRAPLVDMYEERWEKEKRHKYTTRKCKDVGATAMTFHDHGQIGARVCKE